ncbi:MAG: hypothetical protein IJQ84_07725 [Paludibacteraceae bacterium]|nr:hypothetical protein [Paludibacteraceae bacterium]
MAYNDPKLALGKRRAQDTSSAEYRRKQDTCWMASNPMNDVLNPNAISGNERRWDGLFRTKQTKKEPACSVVEQAGVR